MAQNKGAIVHTQKKRKRPIWITSFFLSSNSLTRSFVNSSFLNSGVLFLSFCHDCGRGLCAVSRLRIGRSRADRAPSLTARHAHCHADHRY
jgi:hypothetical protein